jgi:hypothetical protein
VLALCSLPGTTFSSELCAFSFFRNNFPDLLNQSASPPVWLPHSTQHLQLFIPVLTFCSLSY